MYGTIARLQVKPGKEQQFLETMGEYERLGIPGFVGTTIYRIDGGGTDYFMAVAFEDRESYRRNAKDPEQDRRYREMRELLTADPAWHDGEIVLNEGAVPAGSARR